MKTFTNHAVAAHFESFPPSVKRKMLALRELIFDVAAKTQGVGELEETLKWREPAYVTARPNSGSTVRIDWKAKCPDQYAIYFNCNTDLVDSFRTAFSEVFSFEGKRAIVFNISDKVPMDELAVCIAAALTYHARKPRKRIAS